MSTLRISNIEAKADISSPTIDEKVKITNSQGAVLMQLDGKNSGITTVGINTTAATLTVSGNNVTFAGSVTSSGVSTFSSGIVVSAGSTAAPSISPTGDSNTGIFFPSADTIAFGEGGAEAARIDSSGRVGIGTTSPSDLLHIKATNPVCIVEGTGAYSGFSLQNSGGSTKGFVFVSQSGGVGQIRGESIAFTNADASTERARIDSSGSLLVGTFSTIAAAGGARFQLTQNNANWIHYIANTGSSGNIFGQYIQFSGQTPNNATSKFLACEDSTAERLTVRSNGGIANYSANNVNLSDRNVKKDIAPAVGTWDCLKEWEIVNFRYKDQPDDADLNMGVIAQQVAESCPEVIQVFQEAKEATETKPAQEERLGIKEQQMYWMAIKALQEAQVRIEQLEAEMAEVKAQLA